MELIEVQMEKAVEEFVKENCQCHKCVLFGVCPYHGWKLTKKEIDQLKKKARRG